MATACRDALVVVGASAGGLDALKVLLNGLGSDFPFPVLVTKHLAVEDEEGMLDLLASHSGAPVSLANDKQEVCPGHIYLAPGGYHLQVEKKGFLSLSTDERVCHSRPSIDVLFQTAADAYGKAIIGVILTGANRDGAEGIAAIKRLGGKTIAQNPVSAEVGIMPKAAIATGCVDEVLELKQISDVLRVLTGHA